jgi:hypothetical protein
MGGAVCFSIYQKTPQLWRGVVFQAPMCKIKEDMVSKNFRSPLVGPLSALTLTHSYHCPKLPPPFVVKLFLAIVGKSDSNAFSELPIAPSKKSLLNDVFKSEEKRRLAKDSPLFYGDRKPRLASARELLVGV